MELNRSWDHESSVGTVYVYKHDVFSTLDKAVLRFHAYTQRYCRD